MVSLEVESGSAEETEAIAARLARAISRFSLLAAELSDLVREIDVNPIVCGRDIAAVDALFVAA